MPGRFDGKRVLVPGGAGSIGAATVEAFAREGASVVIGDLQDERGESLARRLTEDGAPVTYVRADCTEEAGVAALVDATTSLLGGLDIAANVLGGAGPEDRAGSSLHETPLSVLRRTMAISFESVFLLMQHEVPVMQAQGHGAIVNVSSMAAVSSERLSTPSYGAAKAALNHMTCFAAADYAKDGIRVNAILPGTTSSPALHEHYDSAELARIAAAQHAIPRLIEPGDQADAILFLASDDAKMITGSLLQVDAGRGAFGLLGPSPLFVG